ncbi:hypothetical protein GIB67_014975 [Kingdonia uniflora]|uniref:phosphopyruvate hydratase n=1 Tax=Kingdonia uniflora TaxID=39325 RepID=A0A7J7MTD9_9MAGN|nr:hypothetical protein GIB67_014975 [Kingdonia uniflora]
MDAAATNFCIGTKYDLDFNVPNKFGQNFKTGEDMIEMYTQLGKDYPIASIEKPFDKDDWEHTKLFASLGICQVRYCMSEVHLKISVLQVVGDDLLIENPKRIKKAIDELTCNALLLKVNQIGTITEAIEDVKLAKYANWGIVVSHRCGKTVNSFIANLAVSLATCQIKAGTPYRGERLAKYNEVHILTYLYISFVLGNYPFGSRFSPSTNKLVQIEEELGDEIVYAGENWR